MKFFLIFVSVLATSHVNSQQRLDNADLDDDNDGTEDLTDSFPNDPRYALDDDLDSIPDEWEQDSRLSLWFSPTRQPPRSSTTPSRSDNESRISKPRDLTISKYAVFRDNTIKLTSDEEKNTDYDFDDKSATDNRLNWHFSNEENVDIDKNFLEDYWKMFSY